MGFLDRWPFNAEDPDGRALLKALLAAYYQSRPVKEFVLGASLDPADFVWDAPMSQVWPEVLRKAADQKKLRRLIEAVHRDSGSVAYEVIRRLASEPVDEASQYRVASTELVLGSSRRLAYLEQVRRIAPPDPPGLVAREEELAELARFCVEPDGGPYVWWQAGAWAGKSALLSTFVLRPPPEMAERVRIVSFFITARLAAQDTREAFIQVLLEQLAELLGQSLPAVLPEATREAFLLDLLSQAAEACAEAGGRLVLVVDGLDEDRGATTGPDAHSIAGLLPADPPHGMRVIVAGRPNPPIPDDVPDWHPLRDPADYPPAGRIPVRAGHEAAEQAGAPAAAARQPGGAGRARSAGRRPRRPVRPRPGRTDRHPAVGDGGDPAHHRRADLHSPGQPVGTETGPEIYLLGHEELQAAAVAYLGGSARRLPRSAACLGGWLPRPGLAAGDPGIPAGAAISGSWTTCDLPRMIECAGDLARHDRMLDLTGGDAAALAEARTALDRIATQEPPIWTPRSPTCHRDQLPAAATAFLLNCLLSGPTSAISPS